VFLASPNVGHKDTLGHMRYVIESFALGTRMSDLYVTRVMYLCPSPARPGSLTLGLELLNKDSRL